MVNMPSIVRLLSASLSGLALTWFVIHIPGEYAYASVWLMPTVAGYLVGESLDRKSISNSPS
jgi:hypothetical protein